MGYNEYMQYKVKSLLSDRPEQKLLVGETYLVRIYIPSTSTSVAHDIHFPLHISNCFQNADMHICDQLSAINNSKGSCN